MSLDLLCDVPYYSVNNIVLTQSEQVASTTPYQALEHKDVSVHLHSSTAVTEVCMVNFVSLFEVEIERRSINHLWSLEGRKQIVGGELVLQTGVDDGVCATENSIETVL